MANDWDVVERTLRAAPPRYQVAEAIASLARLKGDAEADRENTRQQAEIVRNTVENNRQLRAEIARLKGEAEELREAWTCPVCQKTCGHDTCGACVSKQAECEVATLKALCAEAAKVLEPFTDHARRMNKSGDYSYMNERIKDWFGVSDFSLANDFHARLAAVGKPAEPQPMGEGGHLTAKQVAERFGMRPPSEEQQRLSVDEVSGFQPAHAEPQAESENCRNCGSNAWLSDDCCASCGIWDSRRSTPHPDPRDVQIARLREALQFYVSICGNTAYSVTRESALRAYSMATAALAKGKQKLCAKCGGTGTIWPLGAMADYTDCPDCAEGKHEERCEKLP